jgi:hypothetical protein
MIRTCVLNNLPAVHEELQPKSVINKVKDIVEMVSEKEPSDLLDESDLDLDRLFTTPEPEPVMEYFTNMDNHKKPMVIKCCCCCVALILIIIAIVYKNFPKMKKG